MKYGIYTMEGSGSLYNLIIATNDQGTTIRTSVLVTREHIEIGGWSFKREELLLALGVKGGDAQ